MTDLATLVVRLEAEIGKYQENLDKANKQLRQFSDDSSEFLKKVADAFAAYLTIDALEEWGAHVLENADRLQKFSQTTGVAVEDLSRLEYALKSSGVPADQLNGLMRALNDSISDAAGNAKSKAAIAFEAMGISVKDANGHVKNANALLLEIADAFQGYANGANKSALAQTLLSKAGQASIPFLNQGADGIRRLTEESDRLGQTISGDTAEAAEEFNSRLGRLKTLLIDGIGNQVAARLLPTLDEMGKEFEDSAKGADALAAAVEPIIVGIKLLASGALVLAGAFQVAGQYMAGMAAAQEKFFSGSFSEAGRILKDTLETTDETTGKMLDRLGFLWKETGTTIRAESKKTVEQVKHDAPNIAGGLEAQQAMDSAIKKLSEFRAGLAEQVATFGLGDAAAIKYRLTLGNLSDDVAKAGAKGQVLAKSIEAEALALQKLKDTKEITKALADVQVQIASIKGNAGDAAIAQFDAKNAELVTKLRREGNEEGQKQLDQLLTLTVAQADYNEQLQKAQQIQADLSDQEERLKNSREAGALTEIEFQKQLGAARRQAASDLGEVQAAQEKIADQIGNPKLISDTKRLGTQIETLKNQADVLAQSIRAGFEDAFTNQFEQAILGAKSFGDAIKGLLKDVEQQLVHLATQNIGQQLFGSLAGAGGGSGGTGGGLFSTLAGLFAGGAATGRDVEAGMAYKINERTPNSEYFVPDTSGSVVPAEKMGGRTTVNNINVNVAAPSGTVNRPTRLATAATVARAVTLASRRNN